MRVSLRASVFDPFEELHKYQDETLGFGRKYGATASFVGTMRDFNEGDSVRRMMLEHYPGMTEKQLEKIVLEAMARWELLDVLVIHRVGVILPNEAIVLAAVWAPRRGAAFDACRHIMEALKSRAPFWKKESLLHGTRWVEKNSSGY